MKCKTCTHIHNGAICAKCQHMYYNRSDLKDLYNKSNEVLEFIVNKLIPETLTGRDTILKGEVLTEVGQDAFKSITSLNRYNFTHKDIRELINEDYIIVTKEHEQKDN